MTRKGNKGREETGSQGDTRTYTIKESENVEDKRKLRTEEERDRNEETKQQRWRQNPKRAEHDKLKRT